MPQRYSGREYRDPRPITRALLMATPAGVAAGFVIPLFHGDAGQHAILIPFAVYGACALLLVARRSQEAW